MFNSVNKHLAARRILLVATMLLTTIASADDIQRLSAKEIVELLSGNTAVGAWDGVNYRQYFNADGETIYAQEGSRSALGKWRVDSKHDVYQSWWSGSGWASYPVARQGRQLLWLSRSLPPQPFQIVIGQQLSSQ